MRLGNETSLMTMKRIKAKYITPAQNYLSKRFKARKLDARPQVRSMRWCQRLDDAGSLARVVACFFEDVGEDLLCFLALLFIHDDAIALVIDPC